MMEFQAIVENINSRNIIRLPLNVSTQLPARGMVMVQGSVKDIQFRSTLEPDGKGSHWLEIEQSLFENMKVVVGDAVVINIESSDDWIKPEIPADLMSSIKSSNNLKQWNRVSTKAVWEWIRWIRSTKNPITRARRIEVACDKLSRGDKRPCCFDVSRCTVTEVCKSGILIDS